jgi:hypothetical protein
VAILNGQQRAANRKDLAAGKIPRHKSAATVLPADANVIDTTYGVDEATALTSARDLGGVITTDALINAGLLPARLA